MTTASEDDDSVFAGEYVLGTLDPAARAEAERRMAGDPGFAGLVGFWQDRLDPMLDGIAPVPPPARCWRGIGRRLPGGESRRAPGPWRWLGAASGLSALLLASVLWLGQPAPPRPDGLFISDMVSQDGAVRLAALYDADRGEMRVSVGGEAPAAGRDFELWLISGDAAPVSLGVVPRQGQAAMPIPGELRALMAGATLAITDEPRGGAPQGVATGPLVASAPLRRI